MSKRLSDDEKRYFTDQISILKGENERLTKYIEDYEDDTRKVLADECAPDEKHCTCVPVLRKENEALKETLRIDWEVIVDAIDDHDIKQAVIRLWNRAGALLTGEDEKD